MVINVAIKNNIFTVARNLRCGLGGQFSRAWKVSGQAQNK